MTKPQFIELTEGENTVMIFVPHIIAIRELEETTIVYTTSINFAVKESPKEILKKIWGHFRESD